MKKEVGTVYDERMDLMEGQEVLKDVKTRFPAMTSGRGVGLDYRQVGRVIHKGHTQNLVKFVQESGRARRDGKKAESVTVFWEGLASRDKVDSEGRKKGDN